MNTGAFRVGSLFSGIGGLDLGLERAGMTVIWQSEIDPYASKVLAERPRRDVADAGRPGQPRSLVPFTEGGGAPLRRERDAVFGGCGQPGRRPWWDVEPDVGRVAHGVPARMDRLRCLGNAVVPQVAEWIGRRILSVAEGAQMARSGPGRCSPTPTPTTSTTTPAATAAGCSTTTPTGAQRPPPPKEGR